MRFALGIDELENIGQDLFDFIGVQTADIFFRMDANHIVPVYGAVIPLNVPFGFPGSENRMLLERIEYSQTFIRRRRNLYTELF